jgi:hypothetical protein
MAVKVVPNGAQGLGAYPFTLLQNLDFVTHPLSNPRFWIIVPFLAVVTSLGAKFVRLDAQRNLGIYLVELSMIMALLLYGLLDEMRISLVFIPFVVISYVLVWSQKDHLTSRSDPIAIS